MRFSRKAIEKTVAILQLFYLLLMGLGVLAIALGITESLSGEAVGFKEISRIVAIMIFAFVYYLGLSRKIFWIVPLEIIASTFGSIISLFFLSVAFLYSATLLYIFVPAVIINIFFLYFFTRKSVREYFDFTWNKKSVIYAVLIFIGVGLLLQSGLVFDILTKN